MAMAMTVPVELTFVTALLLPHVFAVTLAAFEAARVVVIAARIGAGGEVAVGDTESKRNHSVD